MRWLNALHISNSENLAGEIHETLKAYYDLEIVNFIEFVNNRIVGRYVDAWNGPIKAGLGGSKMTSWQSWHVRARKLEKEDLLKRLTMAEKILAGHKPGSSGWAAPRRVDAYI